MIRTQVQLRWSDMDALGHVNNTKYLEYFELARADLVMDMLSLPHREGATLVVVRHEIDYSAPLTYRREPIVVETRVVRVGTSSFTVASRIADDRKYASIQSVIVAIGPDGSPVPISAAIREYLESHITDDWV